MFSLSVLEVSIESIFCVFMHVTFIKMHFHVINGISSCLVYVQDSYSSSLFFLFSRRISQTPFLSGGESHTVPFLTFLPFSALKFDTSEIHKLFHSHQCFFPG